MPNDHFSRSSRVAALLERPGTKKVLAYILATALVVGMLIWSISSLGRPKAQPAPSPEPAATSTPEPSATPDPLQAAAQVPPAPSAEIAARNIQRRDGFPMLSWDVEAFSTDSRGRMTYAGARTLTGIDVSEHQGEIDWSKVAADGVDFAMLRLGYRGSTQGSLYMDEYFQRNIAAAQAAGVPVGVYFYSQATTVAEAEGHGVTVPVVFDWEVVGGEAARTYAVSRRTLCQCAKAFCDAVKEAGYKPMIYFTRYLGYRKYILRSLTDYGFWYAEYESRPRFAFDFDMWQYSETGRVSGIDGNVDMNIMYAG